MRCVRERRPAYRCLPSSHPFSLCFSLRLTMYSQLIEFVESTCALLGPRCRPCPIFLRNGRVVVVTFDISSVDIRRWRSVVIVVVGVDAPTTASICAHNPSFLPSSSANGRRMTPLALPHPRLSIIMYDAILRSRFRAASIMHRDDDGTRSSRVCNHAQRRRINIVIFAI